MRSPTEAEVAAHEALAIAGVPILESCRRLQVSSATFYRWKVAGEHAEDGPERSFYDRVIARRAHPPKEIHMTTDPRLDGLVKAGHDRETAAAVLDGLAIIEKDQQQARALADGPGQIDPPAGPSSPWFQQEARRREAGEALLGSMRKSCPDHFA